MADDPNKPSWSGDFFVGVPAPFGAFLVMLPLYLNFLGWKSGTALALVASLYTWFIALLMISQIPIFSGKRLGPRSRNVILPALLLATVYVALLADLHLGNADRFGFAYFAVDAVRHSGIQEASGEGRTKQQPTKASTEG